MERKTVIAIAAMGYKEAVFWNSVSKYMIANNINFFMISYGQWGEQELPVLGFKCIDIKKILEKERLVNLLSKEDSYPHVSVLESYFETHIKPDFIFLWNGLNDVWLHWRLILSDKKIPFYILEKSGFSNAYQIEPNGINGLSILIDDNAYKDKKLNRDALSLITDEILSRREVNGFSQVVNQKEKEKLISLKKNKKIIVFFGVWDAASGLCDPIIQVRKKQSPIYSSSLEAAIHISQVIERNDNYHFVIKKHPQDKTNWDIFFPHKNKKVSFFKDINPIDLISLSDVIISISSSLTFVSSLYLKPVILLGRNPLFKKGYVYDLFDSDALKKTIIDAIDKKEWDTRVTSNYIFTYYYLTDYCCTADEKLIGLGVQNVENCLNKIIGSGFKPLNYYGDNIEEQLIKLRSEISIIENERLYLFIYKCNGLLIIKYIYRQLKNIFIKLWKKIKNQ